MSIVTGCWSCASAGRYGANGRQRPYQTKYEWGYLYSALEVDGKNDAQFCACCGWTWE